MVSRKRVLGFLLAAKCLDDGVAREGLLDLAVELAGVHPLGNEPRPRALGDGAHHEHRQRDGDKGHEREQPRDPDHQRDGADEGECLGQHLRKRLLKALGDVIDVIRHAAEQVAALASGRHS